MSTNTYIAIAVAVLVAIGGFFILQGNGGLISQQGEQQEEQQEQGEQRKQAQEQAGGAEQALVRYTDEGYAPGEVRVSVGDVVVFENQSSGDMWPATAIHPTHTIYPGSDIQKCGTAEGQDMFDACGALEPGGSWSFEFNEAGSWGYHDHLQPSNTAKVIVE